MQDTFYKKLLLGVYEYMIKEAKKSRAEANERNLDYYKGIAAGQERFVAYLDGLYMELDKQEEKEEQDEPEKDCYDYEIDWDLLTPRHREAMEAIERWSIKNIKID